MAYLQFFNVQPLSKTFSIEMETSSPSAVINPLTFSNEGFGGSHYIGYFFDAS